MPFAIIEDKPKATFKRAEFLYLTPGTHVVRVLTDALCINTHFLLGKYTITCPGEDCPVCANNRKIISENPENFKNVKGFYSRTRNYVSNVLDRTLVKTCPQCHAEVVRIGANFPTICPECNGSILQVEPVKSNKVKVLSLGVTLAGNLNTLDNSVLYPDDHAQAGNPIGIKNFDIAFIVEGSGRTKNVTVMPNTASNDVVTVAPEQLHDLSKAIIQLTPAEIIEFLKGVQLKDIFTARKSASDVTAVAVEAVEEKTDTEINKLINQLYS